MSIMLFTLAENNCLMSTLADVFPIIIEMGKIRNVPQFLYLDRIFHPTTVKVREELIKFKKENGNLDQLDFIIESPGGSADDAYKIIRALRKSFKTVNVVIPFWAKSAATLLSLGASTIIMDEYAEFGPLDVQLIKEKEDSPDFERESALNDEYSLKRIETRSLELFQTFYSVIYENADIPINKHELSKQIFDYLSNFYEPLMKQINPFKLGDKKRKLLVGEKYAEKLLQTYHPKLQKSKKDYLVDYFINGCPDHGYVIDYDTIYPLLDGVQKSSTFGTEYEAKLSELSLLFMKNMDDITYIGFIKEEPAENSDGTVSKTSTSTATD
jgi:serine dehydrogenase proteinase